MHRMRLQTDAELGREEKHPRWHSQVRSELNDLVRQAGLGGYAILTRGQDLLSCLEVDRLGSGLSCHRTAG